MMTKSYKGKWPSIGGGTIDVTRRGGEKCGAGWLEGYSWKQLM